MIPPTRTGNDPNKLDMCHSLTQTKNAQAVKIRFRSVFCKVLPEIDKCGWQKSILYCHVEHLRVYSTSQKYLESCLWTAACKDQLRFHPLMAGTIFRIAVLHHNYIMPHGSIDGRTPAEVVGMDIRVGG